MTLRESTISTVDEELQNVTYNINDLMGMSVFWLLHEAVCMPVHKSTAQLLCQQLENEIRKTLRARFSNS